MALINQIKLCLFIALLLTINFSEITAQKQNENWLEGVWEGQGVQSGQSWPMRLTVSEGRYLIEYPSLGCSGVWNVVDVGSKKAKFIERITNQSMNCVETGKVMVEKVKDEEIRFSFALENSKNIVATGVLRRTANSPATPAGRNSGRSTPNNAESTPVQGRRPPRSSVDPAINESDSENRYRGVGKKLAETAAYDLYEYLYYDPSQQCFNSPNADKASLILVLKDADPDYIVSGTNESYRRILENEILPMLNRKCRSLSEVRIENYFRGIWISNDQRSEMTTHYKEYASNDPEFSGFGREVSIDIKATIDSRGQITYSGEKMNSLAAIRDARKKEIYWQENKEAIIKKAADERRAEEKRQAEAYLNKKREAHRAKASEVLALYKKGGGGKDYNFTGYSQQTSLQNVYTGNFEPFTDGLDSTVLDNVQSNYMQLLLGGGSLDASLREMSAQLENTKRIVGLRLPIMIAYFAYHQAFEEQCYPKNREIPWIKGTRRTDTLTRRGNLEIGRIEGETYVYYVREPFYKAFTKTYRAADEGNLAQLFTETSLSTRREFQSDFVKFLKAEGCSSPNVRHLEINLYLASEWLLPLQELLPPESLQPIADETKVKPAVQKAKPIVKKSTKPIRRKN